MTEPDDITVIVHGAKGLRGRKAGRHKYSVIFGLGPKKYRTAVVKDPEGTPEWHEESVIHCTNILDQVFFIVTEKDDILGQINIPVTSLSSGKGKVMKTPLQPHKKCPHPKGEIIYQCYISSYRETEQIPIIKLTSSPHDVTGFNRIRHSIGLSPILPQKPKKESKSSLSSLNKRFSRSIHDLFSLGKQSTNSDLENPTGDSPNEGGKSRLKRGLKLMSMSISSGLDQVGHIPVISSVSPMEGPPEGGTRITIVGKNLGLGKSDIVELSVCGCDCLISVEYESENKIYCISKRCQPGKGDIVFETISGGKTVMKNVFNICEPVVENSVEDSVFENGDVSMFIGEDPADTLSSKCQTLPRNMGRFKKKHVRHSSESATVVTGRTGPTREELMTEVEKLKKENEALKRDNTEMKSYIDKLVAKVIIHCPEALANDDEDTGQKS